MSINPRACYTADDVLELFGDQAVGVIDRLPAPWEKVNDVYAWRGHELLAAVPKPGMAGHVTDHQQRKISIQQWRAERWPGPDGTVDERARRDWLNSHRRQIAAGEYDREGRKRAD